MIEFERIESREQMHGLRFVFKEDEPDIEDAFRFFKDVLDVKFRLEEMKTSFDGSEESWEEASVKGYLEAEEGKRGFTEFIFNKNGILKVYFADECGFSNDEAIRFVRLMEYDAYFLKGIRKGVVQANKIMKTRTGMTLEAATRKLEKMKNETLEDLLS